MSEPISEGYDEFVSGLSDALSTQTEAPVEDTASDAPAEADTAQPRDEQGRFTSIASTEDPEVQGFLDKYGGDPEKAFKGAIEAYKLAQRQTDELGELRKIVQEDLPRQINESRTPMVPGNIGDLIEQDPGQVALWALQNNAGDPIIDAAMEEWYNQNPRQAANFEMELRMEAMRQQFEQQQAPIQQSLQQQQQQAAFQQFAAQYPDVGNYTQQIQQVASTLPHVASLLQNPDVSVQTEALRTLYLLAKSQGSSPAQPDTSIAAQAAAADQAKADAAIITGGTSGHTDPVADPSFADQLWDTWGALDINRIR